jgi:hypothetical protein
MRETKPKRCSLGLSRAWAVSAQLATSVLLSSCDGSFAFDVPSSVAAGAGGSVAGGASGAAGVAAGGAGLGGSGAASGLCTVDANCGLATLHCDASSGQCVECVGDQQCPTARPACLVPNQVCVACSATVSCASGQLCDLQTNKCLLICTTDADCGSGYRGCGRSGTCETCDDDDDCSVTLGGTECQRSAGECVQCLAEEQCSGQTSHCALPLGLCVACRNSADCGGSMPFCDPVAHACSAAVE